MIFGNEIKAFTRNNLITDFFCGSISNSLPRGFLAAFFKTNTLKLLKQKAPTTRKYQNNKLSKIIVPQCTRNTLPNLSHQKSTSMITFPTGAHWDPHRFTSPWISMQATNSKKGGTVVSWLVRSSPDRVVRVRALTGDIVLCSWDTLLSRCLSVGTGEPTAGGVTLRWTSISSRGE